MAGRTGWVAVVSRGCETLVVFWADADTDADADDADVDAGHCYGFQADADADADCGGDGGADACYFCYDGLFRITTAMESTNAK